MTMPPIRVYADTSVFGGVFDVEFEEASREFFAQVVEGRFRLVASAVVDREIRPAPVQVQVLFAALLPLADIVPVTAEAEGLAWAYIEAGAVTADSQEDALHVAPATVHGCQLVVSWDFRHLVHFTRSPVFRRVNIERGYAPIAIHSPLEVIQYDDEGV
jgi:predicted nucleic acid-binding protein